MIELKVVTVTDVPDKYPEYAKDTADYPYLKSYVEDEVATFVVDTREPGNFWLANEFFDCCLVTAFLVDPTEIQQ